MQAIFFLSYIGPGAGFAFAGSLAVWLIASLLVIIAILLLPLRMAAGLMVRGRHRHGGAKGKRVVLIGLDGLDPRQARRLMREGKLPALAALAEQGIFSELRTTQPPVSPAAWSSFITGVNPGKHNIYDFITRDLRTYLPELSTARVRSAGTRGLFSRTRTDIDLLRKSKPFWQILGKHGIFSTILRVPVTFPPEPFSGLCLSGMGVPDLRGTQGTFTVYESGRDREGQKGPTQGGLRIPVSIKGNRIISYVPGPLRGMGIAPSTEDNSRHYAQNNRPFFLRSMRALRLIIRSLWDCFHRKERKDHRDSTIEIGHFPTMTIPIVIDLLPDGESVRVRVSGQTFILRKDAYSDWITLRFRTGWRKISGICRLYLVSLVPEFRLYLTPIQIDPERPAMPISHPHLYSAYLAKRHGPFATLGLAEDTAALNEGVIGDEAFLRQAYDIHEERESIFFDALDKTREGFCAGVFELPDRIQHMFSSDAKLHLNSAVYQSSGGSNSVRNMLRRSWPICEVTDSGAIERLAPLSAPPHLGQAGLAISNPDSRRDREPEFDPRTHHPAAGWKKIYATIAHHVRRSTCVTDVSTSSCSYSGTGDPIKRPVTTSHSGDKHYQGVIDQAYCRMDKLVGRAMKAIDDTTTLIVMSDHGFTEFRRGVNLNAWLKKAGYLTMKAGADGTDWLEGVDWKKTKAYSLGLSGIYLNIRGREAGGILSREEAEAVKRDMMEALGGLKDSKTGETAIHGVYDSRKIYWGPYVDQGPDILVGFAEGYRAAWEGARGRTDGEIFTENTKRWSGDHCVDAALVPGVFFCNRPLALNGRIPQIADLAPTILNLFGIEAPGYMDGRMLQMNVETAKE